MYENWCALVISILKPCTPEQAFSLFSSGKKSSVKMDKRDLLAVSKLKAKGYSWVQLGELFGTSPSALHHRMTRKGMMN